MSQADDECPPPLSYDGPEGRPINFPPDCVPGNGSFDFAFRGHKDTFLAFCQSGILAKFNSRLLGQPSVVGVKIR